MDNASDYTATEGVHMIGELRFPFGRRTVRARLTDELTWKCDEKVLEDYLNRTLGGTEHARGRHYAPLYYLYQAGERLGAEVRPARKTMTLTGAGV